MVRSLIEKGTIWRAGNDRKIRCYMDHWMGENRKEKPQPLIDREGDDEKTSAFIDEESAT